MLSGLHFRMTTMPRPVLPEASIHPSIRQRVADYQGAIVREVQEAAAKHAVLVVGMRQNPFPRKARKALDGAGIAHHYLEYGSYLGDWRRRGALKMWTGWPTFPMIFVKSGLIGGFDDLQVLLSNGELKRLLGT